MLRCVVRQLEIAMYHNLPAEAQAGACRIIFETHVRIKLMLKSPSRISQFAAARWFDEQRMLIAMQEMREAPWIAKRLRFVEGQIQELGLNQPPEDKAAWRSRKVGLRKEHEALYTLFSLYCHASGMLAAEEYQTCYKAAFIHQAQHYAGCCFYDVQRCVEKLLKEPSLRLCSEGDQPQSLASRTFA